MLGIEHKQQPCGWAEVLVNALEDSRDHIPEAMAKEAHMIFPVSTLLWAWQDHQGISGPQALSPRQQDERRIFMLPYIEPVEEILLFRSCF